MNYGKLVPTDSPESPTDSPAKSGGRLVMPSSSRYEINARKTLHIPFRNKHVRRRLVRCFHVFLSNPNNKRNQEKELEEITRRQTLVGLKEKTAKTGGGSMVF